MNSRQPILSMSGLGIAFAILSCVSSLFGQTDQRRTNDPVRPPQTEEDKPVTVAEFRPRSMLRVPETGLQHARFPVIDIHGHFGRRLKGFNNELVKYVELMDRNRIAVSVSLDAPLGDGVQDHLKFLWTDYRDRFVVFAHIDFRGNGDAERPETWALNQPGFVRHVVEQLRSAKQAGVSGVKFFKNFGLTLKNADGTLVKIDDTRWDPVWQECGKLKLPVLIHTADPAAFFLPVDKFNERYEELSRHPDWSFHGDQFPSRTALLDARNRVIARHPETIFIGAHMANNAEDLATVGKWLDAYPNLCVEFASRIGELGRQPYSARRFIIRYQDRVLFGTDGPWPEQRLRYYWRFLETYDEYFPYSEKIPPPQGLWQIYGLGLPDEVLQKVYFQNALRLIPEMAQKYETAAGRFN